MFEQSPSMEQLQATLADENHPIGMRMRAAYFLRHLHATESTHSHDDLVNRTNLPCKKLVVECLSKGLMNERHGSLMRHEFAYILGQLRDSDATGVLESILLNTHDCVVVRHEAAEALGAIGSKSSEYILRSVMLNCKVAIPELSDTCQLALKMMEWRENGEQEEELIGCACMLNPYSSVDPAPPNPVHKHLSDAELGDLLCDPELNIFERYRAMFTLRNRSSESEAAVLQLCRTLTNDTSSALLRHEVAYVLGQVQHPSSVEALEGRLRRVDEHSMVRHEAAEALGAIEGRWNDVERILMEFSTDENQIVRESCLVALDSADYWGHNKNEDIGVCTSKSTIDPAISFASQKGLLIASHFNTSDKK